MGGDAIPVIKKRRLSFLFCNKYIDRSITNFIAKTDEIKIFLYYLICDKI